MASRMLGAMRVGLCLEASGVKTRPCKDPPRRSREIEGQSPRVGETWRSVHEAGDSISSSWDKNNLIVHNGGIPIITHEADGARRLFLDKLLLKEGGPRYWRDHTRPRILGHRHGCGSHFDLWNGLNMKLKSWPARVSHNIEREKYRIPLLWGISFTHHMVLLAWHG